MEDVMRRPIGSMNRQKPFKDALLMKPKGVDQLRSVRFLDAHWPVSTAALLA
jgi:hypothetical protein